MESNDIVKEINDIRSKYKGRILIPVHHYQGADVSAFADFLGDSYKLAVECSRSDAEFIVFCGVLFMAEGADILKKPHQKVVIPAFNADCPMANMADIKTVDEVFHKIKTKTGADIVPVVYMNSYADLKAFCGKHGGAVCTSSNAHVIVDYYLKQGKKVLFFPDANLGVNTGFKLGLTHADMILSGRLDAYSDEKIILWDGFCPVHKRFSPGDVTVLKRNYPGIKIIVHPECPEEVTALSDEIGSTEFILNTINKSPAGSVWGVGTETVFVDKLSAANPDKTIVPLKISECVNMKKTNAELLLKTLRNIAEYIESGEKSELANIISVSDLYKSDAAASLNKMIEIVEMK